MSGQRRSPNSPVVTVVGIGADGWDGVPERLRALVLEAEVVLGGPRHLGLLPAIAGQRREPWPSPLREQLPALLASLGSARVVALASGDPLVAGIGSTLIDLLGADSVRVEPAVSSPALARARMGWPAESVEEIRLSDGVERLRRLLTPGQRVLVLSADAGTPARVADLLVSDGYAASSLTVLGDLGAQTETRRNGTAESWSGESPPLNVIAVEVAGPPGLGWVAGLPDDAFEHDGQLTKRDLRASALARLAPTPGQRLWDVGAGAGSVAIEWLRAYPRCTATAIEADPARAQRIGRNAARLGVPQLSVVTGRAPQVLAGLPAPDAIFVGGGATAPGLLEHCLGALTSGGRLVVHGVTLESERVLGEAYAAHGGELTRISVETAAPLGGFTGWSPARAVTQWAWRAAQ